MATPVSDGRRPTRKSVVCMFAGLARSWGAPTQGSDDRTVLTCAGARYRLPERVREETTNSPSVMLEAVGIPLREWSVYMIMASGHVARTSLVSVIPRSWQRRLALP